MLTLNTFSSLVCLCLMLISAWSGLTESRHIRHEGSNHSNVNHTEVLLARELSSRMMELRSQWNCSEPKPRLVYIHEENHDRIASNIQWVPPVAVLHRCEHHTGCCFNHPGERCRPIQTEQVSILFKHIDVLKNEQTYERLTFTNHTQCGCISELEGQATSTTTLPTSTSTTPASTPYPSLPTTEASATVEGIDIS